MAGSYEPLAYVLPGLAERAASSPTGADAAGRLATVAVSIVLLLAMALLLWDPLVGPLSLLGSVVAITPMVLFICSIVNPSALETAAGLAFMAALLRLARPSLSGAYVWSAVAVTGALVALSRTTGALWIVLELGIFLAVVGGSRAVEIGRARPRATAATVLVLAGALALNRAWEVAYGSDLTRTGPAATAWLHWLSSAEEKLPRIVSEWVGIFGWDGVQMPAPAYLGWELIGATLLAGAVLVGSRRQVITVLATLALVAGVAIVLEATLLAVGTGGLQARHVMPLLATIPLLAGEIIVRNRNRARSLNITAVTRGIVVLAAAIQIVAWYWNAHRAAVGTAGPLFFLHRAEWAPPLGWTLWFAVAVLGACATVGAVAARDVTTPRRGA